jgi:hypothetical protein
LPGVVPIELLTPRGGPRQKAVAVARVGAPRLRNHFGTKRRSDGFRSTQVTDRLRVADVCRPQPARRSGPRACRLRCLSTGSGA